MQAVRFAVTRWSAWAPGLDTKEQWSAWAQGRREFAADNGMPSLDFLPALQRRRLSDLSKLALWAAIDCAQGARMRTVFASPHGEIHRTQALLDDLAAAELLSPTAFSLSVHNTASGLYSIAADNCAPSTALAAGADTLEMAVLEAVGALQRDDRVLLVFADEALPARYSQWDSSATIPLALALLIEKVAAGPVWQIAVADGAAGAAGESHALSVLRWLHSDQRELRLSGERRQWLWSR